MSMSGSKIREQVAHFLVDIHMKIQIICESWGNRRRTGLSYTPSSFHLQYNKKNKGKALFDVTPKS